MSARILVVDDDRSFRLSTAELLRQDGHAVSVAATGAEAASALEGQHFDLLLLDVRMPGIDGVRLVEVLRRRGQRIPVLMISGYATVAMAVESLHLGADDFLTKPVDPEQLSARVAELLALRPVADGPAPAGLVGSTTGLAEVVEAVRRVAPSEATVLVTGETGTGKELVARAVHDLSPRAARPFVPVNCAALAEGLLESELFGHVRGAFTGAVADKEGLFAAAHGGTLLLDEVGDMSLRLQQRLLRVLQEREVVPVGSSKARPVDVRVVAATHRDLAAEAAVGRFREDLYYRLNVFRIKLPPLRERREDIPLLVSAALQRLAGRSPAGQAEGCSPLAMRILRAYAWPGNVRQLFAVVEAAVIRAAGERVEAQHLPPELRAAAAGEVEERYKPPADQAAERRAILAALAEADGVRSRAADLLGMSRTTLWRRMRAYGIGDEEAPTP
ncbi:MAG: sigma-54 dependent transcriptional regulator [Gemmatimonadota bacterium]